MSNRWQAIWAFSWRNDELDMKISTLFFSFLSSYIIFYSCERIEKPSSPFVRQWLIGMAIEPGPQKPDGSRVPKQIDVTSCLCQFQSILDERDPDTDFHSQLSHEYLKRYVKLSLSLIYLVYYYSYSSLDTTCLITPVFLYCLCRSQVKSFSL